ncbi:MAG TPA: hypothetical protein VFH73_16670, partial [Polyangia bacterium]|nr:hypothetical protein [Polyangia bacterium]
METETPGPEDAGLAKIMDRSPRRFEVHCVFQRDSGFNREVTGHLQPEDGTSFMGAPEGAVTFAVQAQGLEYQFVLNAKREFSGVRSSFSSTSVQEARTTFLRGLTPMLDHISYLANTPLIIGQTLCIDRTNGVTSFGYTSP